LLSESEKVPTALRCDNRSNPPFLRLKDVNTKIELHKVTGTILTIETIFISKENGQLPVGADDLIQLIRGRVIAGKNITT
jgi:hypothetical protein